MVEKEIAPEVMHWMAAHPWPGNVRELQNFVRRLTVFASTERVDMDLVRLVCQGAGLGSLEEPCSGVPRGPLGAYKSAKAEAVKVFTQASVHELLAQTRGNVSEAARISGLSRVALQKILARMGENAALYRAAK